MEKAVGKSPGLRMLVRALCIYVLAAFLLLVLASFTLWRSNVGSESLGYVSSAVSFLAAFLSARFLMHSQNQTSLAAALLFGLFLVIVLLTFGFLTGKRSLDPSGVLSVVSFTYAGVLAGSLLCFSAPGKRKRSRPSKR